MIQSKDFDRLYVVTPEGESTKNLLAFCKFFVAQKVPYIQFRDNKMSNREFVETALELSKAFKKGSTKFIINNRYMLLDQLPECAGVHLGQDDIPPNFSINRRKYILGISINNFEHAQKTINLKPNYFGFGSVYETTSKLNAQMATMEDLTKIKKLKVPLVAIGGIKPKHFKDSKFKDFKYLAMINGSWDIFNDPETKNLPSRLDED